MIGPLKDVKRLIRKYAKAREPLSNIPADDWNEALDVLTQNRPLHLGSGGPSGWRHPWEIVPIWSGGRKLWRYEITPGFVNGEPPLCLMDRKDAPKQYKNRDEDRVEVPLTHSPQPVIQTSHWRRIGPDASPVGATQSPGDLSVKLNFEGVPEYFQAIGVGDPPNTKLGQFGVETVIGPNTSTRLLRAVDVILTQPRPAVKAEVNVGGGPINGSFATVDLVYQMPDRKEPTIEHRSKYESAALSSELDLLSGGLQDEPWDKIHIATIYAVSPRGAREGSDPDATWTLHPDHKVFWNLNHGTNRIPQSVPFQPLVFPMHLAGGAGTLAVNSALAVINDNADLVLEYLRAARLTGRFWTT